MGQGMIVIPAYNEQATIGAVVSGAKKYCDVLVVDDCSADATAETARKNGARVVLHSRNMGYDSTLNTGIAEAAKTADFIILMDADGQHNPDDIPKFIDALKTADMVVGIRPYRVRLSEKVYAMVAMAKLGIRDPLCGFKAFTSAAYRKIGYYDSIGSIGTEFMFAAKKNGFRLTEVEISLNKRADAARFESGVRLRAEWKIFLAMLKTLARYLF